MADVKKRNIFQILRQKKNIKIGYIMIEFTIIKEASNGRIK